MTTRGIELTDVDKACALLCALDGPAGGILTKFDDPAAATYINIKKSLERGFRPTDQVDAHEQALSQLHMSNSQHIREIEQEVQKLVHLPYSFVDHPTREHFAIKYIIQAIGVK